MGVIISTVTGISAGAFAWCGKVFGSLMAKAAGLCAKLGLKLLSVNWIKTICQYVMKILSVIRKTIFNAKFVTLLKCLLSVAIFALAVVQTIFLAIGFFGNISLVTGAVGSSDYKTICGAVLIFGGFAGSLCACVKFVFSALQRRVNLRFVGVLMLAYLIVLYCHGLIPTNLTAVVLERFRFVDVLGVLTAVYAFFTLFGGKHPVSVPGVLLIGLGLALLFVFFRSGAFFNFLHYELLGEGDFFAKDLNACLFVEVYQDPGSVYSGEGLLLTWCGELAQGNAFLKSVLITFNLFVIFGSTLLPYLFLSAAAGMVAALVSDRVRQYVDLTRSLAMMRFALLYAALMLCASLVIVLSFRRTTDLPVVISVSTGGAIGTLSGVILEMILLAAARKLITDKPCEKSMKIGLK